MRQQPQPNRHHEGEREGGIGHSLAAVNERLDALTWQLEQMTQPSGEPRAAQPDERTSRISDAMARLDRRLDQVAENQSAGREPHRGQQEPHRGSYAPPSPPQSPAQSRVPASWAAQIAARQRALDGAPTTEAAPSAAAPRQTDERPAHVPQFTYRSTENDHAHARPAAPETPMAPQANRGPSPTAQHAARQHPSAPAQYYSSAAPTPPAHGQYYASAAPMPQQHYNPAPDLEAIEEQLERLSAQISSLHQPYEQAFHTLRGDLAGIGRTLTDAMPRLAIEALESQIRGLAERIDRTAGADHTAFAALQREVAEVRNSLHQLNPAENLSRFEDALRTIYFKVEQVAAGQQPPIDPAALGRLEQAVASLQGTFTNAVPHGAIAQLATDLQTLATKVDRAASDGTAESLGRLEARLAALMEGGYPAPGVEHALHQLSERLDHNHLSQGDQLALSALEDRIVRLSEKLDASDTRLGHLDSIERGLADLLVYLEELRQNSARSMRAPSAEPVAPVAPQQAYSAPAAPAYAPPPAPAYAPPAAPAPVPPAQARTPFDLVTGISSPAPAAQAPEPPPALPPLAPRSAPVEIEPPRQQSAPPPAARTMPRNAPRQPIDPNLPPDTPLEPGSGAPRVKPGSAAARIAASEAALGNARPAAAEPGGKSAAIAAARNAAKAAYLETQAKPPRSFGQLIGQWLPTFKKKAKELPSEAQAVPAPQPAMPAAAPVQAPSIVPAQSQPDDGAVAPLPRGKKVLKVLKTLLIAASVAIIVVGVAQTVMDYLIPDTPSGPRALPPKDQSKTPIEPKAQAPATTPSAPVPQDPSATPAPEEPQAAPTEGDPDSTNSTNRGSEFFNPSPSAKMPDVTGSIPRSPAAPRAPAPSGQSSIDALPDSISPALRIAAAAKDPAAQYELGARYADGRGVPQDLQEAARWFGLAADAGFAPAQFRLGSLNEKGEGMRKDTQTARRLYLAAASKGHAKAMHNLAVLYAEGIDGKPDYKAASEWFRKAAGYGVTDSQYNLAILFARGIGLQANLGESYRWFALAAANGDRDAAKKRDEVAARLDENTVMTLKLAVQSFVPEHEPDEAINLGVPPGGWDHPTGPTAKSKRRAPTTSAAR